MATEAQPPSKPSTLAALAVFLERRSLVMLALGFSSGLPNLLMFDTLSAWLRDAGLGLGVISLFGLATLTYTVKFLWAPLVDRTTIPRLTTLLGHRRAWMLVCQLVVVLGLLLIATTDPKRTLAPLAAFTVLVGFAGATQDIVIDAWRIEAAGSLKQGALAAAYQWGYRVAVIVAGAAPLAIAQFANWHLSYVASALIMGVGVAGVLGAPREAEHVIRPIPTEGLSPAPLRDLLEWTVRLALAVVGAIFVGSGLSGNAGLLSGGLKALGASGAADAIAAAWAAKPVGIFAQLAGVGAGFAIIVLAALPLPRIKTLPGRYLSVALMEPLANFLQRYGKSAGLILALICVYRLSDFVLNIMNPFYLDLGFSKLEIVEIRKGLGAAMSILGVGLGGFAVARLGLMRSLIIGAFASPLSHLSFAWLAVQGPQIWALSTAISIDNISAGFAGTCLIAYMSSLTGEGFTATQYALFSSLYALLGKLVASQSGRIVEGAAAAADEGGFAPVRALFAHMPPQAFANAMEKSHVSPQALAAGYVVFFGYAALMGMFGIVLTFVVASRAAKMPARAAEPDPT